MSVARGVGLLLGAAADVVWGDLEQGHPATAFRAINRGLAQVLPRKNKTTDALHTGIMVGGAALIGLGLERFGRRSPIAQAATTAMATWAVLGGVSLARQGAVLARLLDTGDLVEARKRLPELAEQSNHELDGLGVANAGVAAVAQRTSEAMVAPLLWGAVAGIPGLLGYRALAACKITDGWPTSVMRKVADLVPARGTALLTVAAAPVVGGSARQSLRTRRLDAAVHPNPNVGQIHAAFAGALEIRLGGQAGATPDAGPQPVFGDGRNPDAGHLTRSVELSRVVGGLAALSSAAIAVAISGVRGGRRALRSRWR